MERKRSESEIKAFLSDPTTDRAKTRPFSLDADQTIKKELRKKKGFRFDI